MTESRPPPLGLLSDDDLERMLLIRHFEQDLLDTFSRRLVGGTTHTCLGQEHVPVALAPLLRPDDFFFSHHRGHGHYLALFDDPAGLLAEIMGREGAVCRGVGGSQHILRGRRFLSTGIQGQSLPVAAGVALHFKRAGNGACAVAAIGDGTWGEGSVYEALNMAQLWALPLLVIVENNGIAQTTPIEHHLAGTIEDRARAFGIRYLAVSSFDVAAIRRTIAEPLAALRRESLPLIIELATVRLGPHSKGDDTRDPVARAALAERDWYPAYRAAFPAQFRRLEDRAQVRLDTVRADVEGRAPATWSP